MDKARETCKICGDRAELAFTKQVILKYDVAFFQCSRCGFIQTEKPYWLPETYESSLFALDTGLIARPLSLSSMVDWMIMRHFDPRGRFLDYGGGSGIFVRLMRDRGFHFFRYDKFVKNIYALCFDLSDLREEDRKFEMVTSFEVLEHFENPLEELAEMFSRSSTVLCSTLLQPADADLRDGWWYFGELHGQHISFYTRKSMEIIARHFGCYYYSNGSDLHLFSKQKMKNVAFRATPVLDRFSQLIAGLTGRRRQPHPESLTMKDAEWIKEQFRRGSLL